MTLIKTTNRTIEVSEINADYMIPIKLNVQSVVFEPGFCLKDASVLNIVENSPDYPVKAQLTSSIGAVEPRAWIFNQRLQVGFIYEDCVFNVGAKVFFNIGELHNGNDSINCNMKMKLNAEDAVL